MFDGVLPQAGRPREDRADATASASPWPLVVLVLAIALLFVLAGALYPEAFASPICRF